MKKPLKHSEPIFRVLALTAFVFAIYASPAHASLESSLMGLKMKITGIVLPLLSVIGVAVAALSFFTGNPNAKQHFFYAILCCVFGFGAEVIVNFISQAIN